MLALLSWKEVKVGIAAAGGVQKQRCCCKKRTYRHTATYIALLQYWLGVLNCGLDVGSPFSHCPWSQPAQPRTIVPCELISESLGTDRTFSGVELALACSSSTEAASIRPGSFVRGDVENQWGILRNTTIDSGNLRWSDHISPLPCIKKSSEGWAINWKGWLKRVYQRCWNVQISKITPVMTHS